jgi:hypothetical protein
VTADPTPLSDALQWVTTDLHGGITNPQPKSLGELALRWGEFVGERLGACTLPGSFADGVLTVHAHDASAASLVKQSSGELAGRLRPLLPGLERLRVVVTRPR